MADQTSPPASDSEFQAFSRRADQDAGLNAADGAPANGDDGGGRERDGEPASSLEDFGIDTGRMAEAANEHVGDLQQMVIDEVRARPLRAIGWAATAGLVVGLLWAR